MAFQTNESQVSEPEEDHHQEQQKAEQRIVAEAEQEQQKEQRIVSVAEQEQQKEQRIVTEHRVKEKLTDTAASEEESLVAQEVALRQTDPGTTSKRCTGLIMVSGLNPSTTDECVQYFFENTWRSGGGPVEMVHRLADTKAVVRFKNKQDAAAVLMKAQLKLDGCLLSASAPDPGCDPLCANGVSSDGMSSYGVFSETVKQTIPNLNVFQLKILNHPKALNDISREFDGVEVCVDMNAKTAHIKAPENTVKNVCTQIQLLMGSLGEVTIQFSPALCRMYEAAQQTGWIQSTMLDHLDLLFHWELRGQALVICAKQSKLQFLEQLFRSFFVEIRLQLEEREVTVLKGGWKQLEAMSHMDKGECPAPVLLLDKNSITIVDIPSKINQTQALLQNLLEEHRSSSNVSSAEDGAGVEKQLPWSQACSNISRYIPNLKTAQLRVLRCPAVLETWCYQHPDLQIHVDQEKQTAEVRASGSTMSKVFEEIRYFVNMVRELKHALSPALVRMFEKEDSREWVQRILLDRNIHRCHWELCDGHIIISGQNSELVRLEETFRSAFREVSVPLEQRECSALSSGLWASFLDSQQKGRLGSPVPVLLLENNSVVIVDLPDNLGITQLALRQLLDQHTTPVTSSQVMAESSSGDVQPSPPCLVESIPYLKQGQLNILRKPRALSKLCIQYPGLTVHADTDRKTAVVHAPENMMQEAFSDLLCYVSQIKDCRVSLTPALNQMFKKDDNREWIQRSLIDKFELVCHWEVQDQHLTISAHSTCLQRLQKMFLSLFMEVKVDVVRTEVTTLQPSALQPLEDRLQRDRGDGPTPVLLLDGDHVSIVDIPSKINTTQQVVKQFVNIQDIISSSFSHSKASTENFDRKIISGLNMGQARVLSSPAVVQRLCRDSSGLKVIVCMDSMSAVLTAPHNMAQKAFSCLESAIKDVRELKVELSPALGHMFGKEDSKAWVQTSLIDHFHLACHWEMHEGHLVLNAGSSQLFCLEQMFRSVFREVKVSLKNWEADTLTSSVWSCYVREQERGRRGIPAPVLLLDSDCVTIVDIAAKVKDTQLALTQLLNDLGS